MADENVKRSFSQDSVKMKNIKNTESETQNVENEVEVSLEQHKRINDEENKLNEEAIAEKVLENTHEEESNENNDNMNNDQTSESCTNEIEDAKIQFSEEEIAAKNRVSEAIRNFTHKLHESISEHTESNFVCSGLSAHSVLSMAVQGAEGDTAKKMQQALSLPEDLQQSCVGYQCFIKEMNNAPKMVFKLASKVYVSSDNELKEKFKDTTATYFNSVSELVDFSSRKATVEKINDWCTKTTDKKIRKIISDRDLGGSVHFLLLNALYFKGVWKTKFLPHRTKLKPYHIDKNTIKEVPMMYNKMMYLYNELEDESAYFIGIPYENENYCMFIIVPKEIDGLTNVEKNYEQVKKAFHSLEHKRKISLYLPSFKVTSTIDLQSHLCQLGMSCIFDGKADFSGIMNVCGRVGSVRQKVFIEVNEDGTEGLSFTEFLRKRRYDPTVPLELTVDRPFLYQIYDNKNGIPLFSGRIIDPTIEDNC